MKEKKISELEAENKRLKEKLADIEEARMLTVEVPDSWIDEEMNEMERDESWVTAAVNLISAVIKLRGLGKSLEEIMEYVDIAYNPPDLPPEGTKEFFRKFMQNTLDILEEDGCEVPKLEDCIEDEEE